MEEQYVLVELNGIVENDWLSKIGEKCRFLGLDTENPFLQLGPYIFQGEYEDTVGTAVVFEEQEENEGKGLKYKCNTHKKLVMQRSFLKKKDEIPDVQSTSQVVEEIVTEAEEKLRKEPILKEGQFDASVSSSGVNIESDIKNEGISDEKIVEQQKMEIDYG